MNDRHPSGISTPEAPTPDASFGHYASYEETGATYNQTGYDGYSTAGTSYGHEDPLFGTMPGHDAGTGQYDAGQWTQQAPGHDAYGTQQTSYDTGGYATTAWIPAQPAPAEATQETSGQWDANTWSQTGRFEDTRFTTGTFNTGPYDPNGQWTTTDHGYDTGGYDTTAWTPEETALLPGQRGPAPEEEQAQDPQGYEEFDPQAYQDPAGLYEGHGHEDPAGARTEDGDRPGDDTQDHAGHPDDEAGYDHPEYGAEYEHEPDATPAQGTPLVTEPLPGTRRVEARPAGRAVNRSRRRAPAKRSALLTVAVPSVCVMGVAGVAAASVSTSGAENRNTTTQAAADEGTAVKPSKVNNELDTQLANLSADADDFADRASRTQERIDLKERQEAERKRKAEEAARKEALRPKFAVPVNQKGLSAYYGQAGLNWMSVHTGIDFPVSYGTPVLAATDGTVRTQYNTAYGNMVIVTAADGTETWYCHLSSTRIRTGSVKAGDTIAYSGNSGNSTGPHLHFEVRPGGGSAIDPLTWLRSHGLDPT
ncbi:peptidoglycan DD-metalloendopeptidase family protein [Streptomyces sp. GC420]|uniref:M23 family metallopeptidase n=1 Tax=Streptomyces sp. GC420 TaxID=2697568 RepID=UPI001415126D|nr:peptidoglycan DD-metalloendopeptidase family protein [Streptomyces sp. GC420]NBM17463.1 peptidoglycan DD-metalloendopeptidase family protein [Streptomyces sp. GC420]